MSWTSATGRSSSRPSPAPSSSTGGLPCLGTRGRGYVLPRDLDRLTAGPARGVLDHHRQALHDSLDGLTEEEARRSLVPSLTTLLGLVKHATFVERVWFDEAVTGRSRAEIGIPTTVEESFTLVPQDTIESVRAAYTEASAASRTAAAGLDVDGIVTGNRRGPLPVRWVYLHLLRELAQHCGHADILREQVLAARGPQTS
ncbi:DinB family protein [Nocardioides sp. cx-169]|uniref:DinB family protein n=1 Tax=Nocardioides sp. cx-169 TaxID=2899080 RepID=UPI001E37177B|nr:DinB family protein [Nocardioides sp. cx-169]MCD4536588.1 DinB family protein [Nocardioides sp. cx-169]